jgi:succinyl-CoA synthetase beta subunit
VPVPEGRHAASAKEAVEAAEDMDPVVIKAQVQIGGRGKAGGIKLARDGGEAEEEAAAYIAGFTAPPGKTMGHAGAIVSG